MPGLRMRDYLTLQASDGRLSPFVWTDSGRDGGMRVRIAAVHSGRVNGNFRFYRPDYMASDYVSFSPPGRFGRPVLWNHAMDERPVGRVVSARYVDQSTPLLSRYPALYRSVLFQPRMRDGAASMDALDTARFIYEKIQRGSDLYSGAGYIELDVRITDPEAVEQVQRGELLTVSVGFATDSAVCSICGCDWADSGRCEHTPGRIYDGRLAFLMAGRQTFEEISFVNDPADPFAMVLDSGEPSGEMKDCVVAAVAGMRPFGGLWMSDSAAAQEPDWRDGLTEEDIAYFSNPDRNYEEMLAAMKEAEAEGALEGAADARLTSEQRKKLKKSQFCGPNRSFPVPDCAHVTAALRLLGRAKLSQAAKDRVRACVMRKARAMGCKAGSRDSAWAKILAWMLDDIRPAEAAGPGLAKTRNQDMLTVEEISTSQLDAASLLRLVAEARALPAEEGQPRIAALAARLADSGWLTPADGWTEEEVRLQLDVLADLLPALPEEARQPYLDRLRAEAESLGLDVPPEAAPQQDAAAAALEEAETQAEPAEETDAAKMSAVARVVRLVEEIESAAEGVSEEEDLEKILSLLYALSEKMASGKYLAYLKSKLSDSGFAVVSREEAEAAGRLRQMVADLKDANRRLLADQKRSLAAEAVFLMALTGEAGFDVMDSASLEAEIDRRSARSLASLKDSLADLQARFFRRKSSEAGQVSGQSESPAAEPQPSLQDAASAEPGIFLTERDVRAMLEQHAIQIYRRLKDGE